HTICDRVCGKGEDSVRGIFVMDVAHRGLPRLPAVLRALGGRTVYQRIVVGHCQMSSFAAINKFTIGICPLRGAKGCTGRFTNRSYNIWVGYFCTVYSLPSSATAAKVRPFASESIRTLVPAGGFARSRKSASGSRT